MTKNDNEEGVSVSATALSLDIISYYYSFLEMLLMGLGVEMVLSIFLLRGAFLVE